MKRLEELLKDINQERKAYDLGFDAGLNGPNMTNCHFGIFSTKERTKEWERGKRAGDEKRKRNKP